MVNKLPLPDKVGQYAGKLLSKTLPFDLSASVTASADLASTNTQSINRNYISSEGDHWRNNKDAITEVAKNTEFNKSVGINQELTSTITSSSEKVKNLTAEMGMHHERAQNISNQIQQVESFGETFNVDGTHKVEERLKSMGLSSRAAHDLIENPTSANSKQRELLAAAKRDVGNQLFGSLYGAPNRVPEVINAKEQTMETDYNKGSRALAQKGENEIGAKRSTDQTALNNKASANDLNQNRVQKQLDKSEAGLNKKHQQMSQEVSQEANNSLAQMKAKQNKQAEAVQTADNKRWTSWIAGRDLPKE